MLIYIQGPLSKVLVLWLCRLAKVTPALVEISPLMLGAPLEALGVPLRRPLSVVIFPTLA